MKDLTNNIFSYWENPPNTKTPEYINLCRESLFKQNSTSNIILLDNYNVKDYIDIPKCLDNVKIAQKTDFIRIALIYKYGGIWLDADSICLKSFSDIFKLLNEYDYIGYGDIDTYVHNAFMCASKQSAIVQSLYNKIIDRLNSPVSNLQWNELGSRLISPILRKYRGSVYIYNYRYFHPVSYNDCSLFFTNEIKNPNQLFKDSYTTMLFNTKFGQKYNYLYTQNKTQILAEKNLLAKLYKKALE